jgi:glycosyltransferase involved in cell wall biosynthesis
MRYRNVDRLSEVLEPEERLAALSGGLVSRLMHLIWSSREDLQHAFPLTSRAACHRFRDWFLADGQSEYVLHADVVAAALDAARRRGGAWWLGAGRRRGGAAPRSPAPERPFHERGVNLLGFVTGEFGLGEMARMTARALATTGEPFAVTDFSHTVPLRAADKSIVRWTHPERGRFVNLLSLNPDHLVRAIAEYGPGYFRGRYNVGYWAWSLDTCPPSWRDFIGLMDEIWVVSSFQAGAFANDRVPVHVMPIAVTTAGHEEHLRLTRHDLGIPEDAFVFLFVFDALTSVDRKNPAAVVEAFRSAFPERRDVVLVLKTMNAARGNERWSDVVTRRAGDDRVRILDAVMDRPRVLALIRAADAYVSLHRAEGFGLGMAEAMLIGKPVVATGYSGNLDFTRPDTACLVRYRLVPVPPGQYVSWEPGQRWADPDVDHAARLMRALVEDREFGRRLGEAARRHMLAHHSPEAIGRKQAERLEAMHAGAES